MQLHQLQYMATVAEEGGFTRAAAKLRVAQPSVSSAIAGLERELGIALFNRSRAGVSLTTAGEALLPWARQALADCDAGRSAVRELLGLQRGRLSIGATPSLTTNLLPPVIAAFHARYPGVELEVHEAGSQDLVDRLEQGRMDLAVLILPVHRPGLEARPLVEEELVLAVGCRHPLARRRELRIEELEDVPMVMFRPGYDLREVALRACRDAGFSPVLAAEGLEMGGVLAMTAAGLGAAVVPESVVVEGGPLKAVRFAGGRLKRTVGLASRRDRPLVQAAKVLLQELEREVAGRDGAAPAPARK